VVLVHGTILCGEPTWAAQMPLAERWRLVVPDRRGYGGSNSGQTSDWEQDGWDIAELLGDGAHLVGLSYGGVGSLFAAADRPEAVRSLCLIEPALMSVASAGSVAAWTADRDRIRREFGEDPRGYLDAVLGAIGAAFPMPDPLPEVFEQGARASIAERFAADAEPSLDSIRDATYPKLVISGGHLEAWEEICDRLAEAIGAERKILGGVGHFLPIHREMNPALEAFWGSAEPGQSGMRSSSASP
jgi:pimeloyl-ACP methyl ester carboxylesterase